MIDREDVANIMQSVAVYKEKPRGPWHDVFNVAEKKFTPEHVRRLIHYDAESGSFYWRRVADGYDERVGQSALCERPSLRYYLIRLDDVYIMAHRVAFVIVEGAWPPDLVDHVNRRTRDNRWVNLRHATHLHNQHNSKTPLNSSTRLKGVSLNGRRYQASIKVCGTRLTLGTYDDPKEAARAYDAAALKHQGAYACTNAMLGLLD